MGAFLLQAVQLIASGLANGCVYGIVALGFVLIYKATETVNLAQGDMMMLGAYVAITFANEAWLSLPLWLAVALTILFMGLFGYAIDALVVRRLRGESPVALLILTIAIGFVLRFAAGAIWGYGPQALETGHAGHNLDLAGVVLAVDEIVVIGATLLLTAAFWAFFRLSRTGLAMQAAAQNELAASYAGIPLARMQSLAWGLAGAMAGIAGILTAARGAVDPSSGLLGIKAFAAAVIGGMGSLPGALAGGLLVGLIEPFAGRYAPAGVSQTAPYLLLFVVLLWRPAGLFVQVGRKKA